MIGHADEVRQLTLGEARCFTLGSEFLHGRDPTEFVEVRQYPSARNLQMPNTLKLRLPSGVQAALKSARASAEKSQKDLPRTIGVKSAASIGHIETGERPVSKLRLRQLVRALDLPSERATTWWRLAIQERIGELLDDGGMPEPDRDQVLSVVEHYWPPAEDEQSSRDEIPAS